MKKVKTINFEYDEVLKNNISTYKKTSNNSKEKKILIDSDLVCIDFDNVKREYANKKDIVEPKSVDALVLTKECEYFIEFKYAKMNSKQTRGSVEKAKDSLIIFSDLKDCDFRDIRERAHFILVYSFERNKEEKENQINQLKEKKENQLKEERKSFANRLYKKAKEEYILFGMDKLKNFYFNNVHTFDENEFMEYITKNKIKHLE